MFQISKHWLATIVWSISMLIVALSLTPANADSSHAGHGEADVEGLSIKAAISPAPAPGVGSIAIYLTVANGTDANVELVGAKSDAFMMGHIHKTAMTDGVMTMAPVAQVTVPAGESVMFEPNGLHIMLMGPKQKLAAGDKYPLTLVLDNGHHLETEVSVVKPGSVMAHDHGSMKMN